MVLLRLFVWREVTLSRNKELFSPCTDSIRISEEMVQINALRNWPVCWVCLDGNITESWDNCIHRNIFVANNVIHANWPEMIPWEDAWTTFEATQRVWCERTMRLSESSRNLTFFYPMLWSFLRPRNYCHIHSHVRYSEYTLHVHLWLD